MKKMIVWYKGNDIGVIENYVDEYDAYIQGEEIASGKFGCFDHDELYVEEEEDF